jgi:hypothetical protein
MHSACHNQALGSRLSFHSNPPFPLSLTPSIQPVPNHTHTVPATPSWRFGLSTAVHSSTPICDVGLPPPGCSRGCTWVWRKGGCGQGRRRWGKQLVVPQELTWPKPGLHSSTQPPVFCSHAFVARTMDSWLSMTAPFKAPTAAIRCRRLSSTFRSSSTCKHVRDGASTRIGVDADK